MANRRYPWSRSKRSCASDDDCGSSGDCITWFSSTFERQAVQVYD
jgi:hypothetical protein